VTKYPEKKVKFKYSLKSKNVSVLGSESAQTQCFKCMGLVQALSSVLTGRSHT
jgi:hypothetical protein